jgi:methionyl aminopeptidase
VLCLSLNEVVVHGQRLREDDLLSVDCGAIVDWWNGDSAVTLYVGARPRRPCDWSRPPSWRWQPVWLRRCPERTLQDVTAAVDAVAREYGYAHLPDHGGHGIGREMHEPPLVPRQPMAS